MFDKLKNAVKGVFRRMFPIRTLKELFGQDIAISQDMITAIEKWAAMYRGGAPWVDEQVR